MSLRLFMILPSSLFVSNSTLTSLELCDFFIFTLKPLSIGWILGFDFAAGQSDGASELLEKIYKYITVKNSSAISVPGMQLQGKSHDFVILGFHYFPFMTTTVLYLIFLPPSFVRTTLRLHLDMLLETRICTSLSHLKSFDA